MADCGEYLYEEQCQECKNYPCHIARGRMKDKPVKIGKSLIHPDPKLVQYKERPCSWLYRNCLDKDLSKNCYMCKKNPKNWDTKPQKRGKHYYEPDIPIG